MNANEIIVGKDYILKIAHNEVKVKVLSNVGHSWIIKTAGGKVMPVQNVDRFIRQEASTGEVPEGMEAPTTPPEAETTATAATMPPEPVTVPTSATPAAETTEPEKKLTMLDAAAQVLKTAGHPMKIPEILDAMQAAGIWKPGLGKTPDRTLISGFGTEIRRRVKNRFRKTAQGTFEYIGGDRHD